MWALETVPVVFRQAVFDGDDGVLLDPRLVERGHLGAGLLPLAGLGEVVGPVLIEGAGGRIQGDGDVLAGHVARGLDRLDDHLAGFVVALEIGGEPALVADAGGVAALVEDAFEGVEGLGSVAQGLGEAGGADGHDHELLEVHAVVGVLAAVEDVHHRHRQPHRPRAAEVGIQRQLGRGRRGPGHRHRNAEDRVGPELALDGRSVQVDHQAVDFGLPRRVHSQELGGDPWLTLATALSTPLPP